MYEFYRKHDKITVIHVYGNTKNYLMEKYKHDSIEAQYTRELTGEMLKAYWSVSC